MPPRRKKTEEAVVVILDVGSSQEEDETSSTTFFLRAKECLLKIIERKIFAESQELMCLILMNSEETNNELNTVYDGYENISVKWPFKVVNWDLARFVSDLKPEKVNSVDWLDAMYVAVQAVKYEQESRAISVTNLVLISRLVGTVNDEQADNILPEINNLSSQFTVIGYGVDQIQEVSQLYSQSESKDLEQLKDSLTLLARIMKKTNSNVMCDFDEAKSLLSLFKGKTVRPTPWKVELEIGTEITFEVAGYKVVAEQERFKWSVRKQGDNSVEASTAVFKDVKSYISLNEDGAEREVAAEDIVRSYAYGNKIIPYADYNKETMSYKSGPKSFKLIGFTKMKHVPKHILQGKGVICFTCGKEPRDIAAFAAFYEALESLQAVGLVRRVYQKDNAPTIGTLYPEILEEKKVLTYIELPYADDEVKMKFPSFKHVMPSIEQKNAVNNLIDALDLTDPEDPDNDLFCPEETFDPYRQFMYYVLAQKKYHPNDSPPSEPPEHVRKLLYVPPEIERKADKAVNEIERLFPLIEIDLKKGKSKNSDADNPENDVNPQIENKLDNGRGPASLAMTVVQVSAQEPERDFEILLRNGEDHTEVCNQMKKVINVLAQKMVETDNPSKLIGATKTLRKSCLEKNYQLYNSWLSDFKVLVQEKNLTTLWKRIKEGNLGLISSAEVATSNVSESDASSFLEIDNRSQEIEVELNEEELMMDL